MQNDVKTKPKKCFESLKLSRSVVAGVLSGAAVFFGGFFVLLMLYINWESNTEKGDIKGLFDYKASAIGDSICLPILVGALVCYILYNRKSTGKKHYILPAIVSVGMGVIGLLIQISWFTDENIKTNWSIPDPKAPNAAGIYHLIFFVMMFALLGWLIVRFFQTKRHEAYDESDKTRDNINTLLQYLIWTSGVFFIFLNFTDDHSEKSWLNIFGLDIFWFLLITAGVFFVVSGFLLWIMTHLSKNKRLTINSVLLLLSGIMTAFAITNIIISSSEQNEGVNVGYIVAAALLLVIFVVPNTENIPGMLIAYIVTALPAVLLEVNVAFYGMSSKTVIICGLVIFVPLIIAIFFHKKDQDIRIHKKAVISSFALLINITAVIIRYMFPDGDNFDALFEELINVVLVTVIPQYVKSVFDEQLAEENKYTRKDEFGRLRIEKDADKSEKHRLEKKRNILYLISAIIFIGVIVMMFSVIIPYIPVTTGFKGNTGIILWIGVVVAVICIIFMISANVYKTKSNKNHFVLWCSIIALGVCYVALSFIIKDAFIGAHIIPERFSPLHLILIAPLICTSLSLSYGWFSNIVMLRGRKTLKNKKYRYEGLTPAIVTAIIIFFGTLFCSVFSILQMIQSDSILSIVIHMLILLVTNIVLPFIIAKIIEQRPLKKPQLIESAILTDPGCAHGVMQDGFLFSIMSIAVEVMTIFYVAKSFTPDFGGKGVINVVVGLFLLLQFSSWALQYCVENDVDHFYRIRDNSDISYKKGSENSELYNNAESDEAILLEQYKALHRHISFQNIVSIISAMPYSLYTIVSMIFTRAMSKENDNNLFIPDIETKDQAP